MIDPFIPGLLERLPHPPKKVAILRASRIGDFLCAVPAFRALRHALPSAEITLITLPMLTGLAARIPYFDQIWEFPGFPGIAEQLFDARDVLGFLSRAQSYAFDLAIQMQGSGVNSNPFTLLLGATWTAGFIRRGESPGRLDAAVVLPENGYEIDRMLAMTEFLGARSDGRKVNVYLREEDRKLASSLMPDTDEPVIGLHASARDSTRRWPVERFAAAANAIVKKWGGRIVLLGEAENQTVAERLVEMIGPGCINLTGKTPLPVLAGVLERLDLLLTNDSGPAHLAYALGTPSVTIFGGGDPSRYGPEDDQMHKLLAHPVLCRPCTYAECPIGYRCLEMVSVEQVVSAGVSLLAIRIPR